MHAGHVNESPFLSIVIFNIYSIALCDQVSGVGDSFIYCGAHDFSIGVLILPLGSKATTAMPWGNSRAIDLVIPSIANFEAQYGASSASPSLPN